jgi:hypothetical protein
MMCHQHMASRSSVFRAPTLEYSAADAEFFAVPLRLEAAPLFARRGSSSISGGGSGTVLINVFTSAQRLHARGHLARLRGAMFMNASPVHLIPRTFQRSLEQDATERLAALMPADARSWCRPEARVMRAKAE